MAQRSRAGSAGISSGNVENEKAVLPADHLMFRLLGDFKEHTKVKIDIFIRDDKIKLEDFFDGSDSKTFNNVLEGLTEVSKYFLNLIANALLQWRSSQHVIPAKSISKPKMDGSDTRQKDITPIVDERYKLIVDYIFCISLLTILNSLTKDNLNDQIGTQIESICFDNFKLERRTSNYSIIIPDLCASILGQLSKYRLRSVSTRFFKEFQICLSSNTLKSKTFPILQGIRFFKVKITSSGKLKQSQEFLSSYLEFFKNQRIKGDLRRAISEILASILRPLTEEKFKPELNYTEWVNNVKELYEFISKKTKKTKDILTSFPLLSILLCCGDKEFFLKNFWGLMDNFIKIKDKQVRPYALESSQYLLECYLGKYSEQLEEVTERLVQFVSHIFPNGHAKKLTLSASDSLDIFVDIICVIANSRLDFAFEKIISDLLRGGDPKDYISNPERMIVGLRAVLLIDAAATNPLTPKPLSFSNSPGPSPSPSPLPEPLVPSSNKVRAVRRVRYGTLNIKKSASSSQNQPSPIEPYLKSLSIFLSQILYSLEGTFGQLLLSNQTKPLNELLEKLRPPGPSCIELLKIAISVIPIAFPAKMSVLELVQMLAKYLIHLDRGISEKASLVLTQLMASRPEFRSSIITGLGKFVLTLSDRMSHLITIVLEKKRELLEMWARSKSTKYAIINDQNDDLILKFKPDPESQTQNNLDVAFVESVAMVFLCSSNGRARRVSLSILEHVRTVHEAFLQEKEDEIIEISTHIRDIIDENGNEYLYRHAQNLNNQIENKYKKQKSPQDFERLAESESKDDQLLWSMCLSDIARATSELCPHSIHKTTELVLARIRPIQPEENNKQQSISVEAEALSIWWRNYIVMACVTIQITDNTAIDIKRKMTEISEQLVSARELFNLITPLLRSTDKFFAESSLMALEKTHPRVLEVLFDTMRPFEHEINITKKTRKKTDGLRSAIGIRRHCLESLKPGELVKRDSLKKSFLEFIQEVLQFLITESTTNNDYLWDNLHYIRFNFCALVHRIVQQLYIGSKEFLDKNLRRDLFRVLSKWTDSEELLREESTNRRFIAFLQQEEKEITKRKEYEIRIYEHASQLSNVASHALSVILLGPYFIDTFKDPNGVIFQWINNMFVSPMKNKIRSVTRLSLQNFLKYNVNHQELIYHCINQCYSLQPNVAIGYFLSLVELYQDQILKFNYSESIITNLIIFNSGCSNSVVRQQALQLLYFLKASATRGIYEEGYYPSAVGSEIGDTYHFAQFELSQTLSRENPDLCYDLFLDMVYRLEAVGKDHQSQMLNYVCPWVEQMTLTQILPLHSILLDSVLKGLVQVTMKYGSQHHQSVEKIWKILGTKEVNIPIIVDFMLGVIEKTRNNDLIPVFKKICVFLGRSSPQKLVDSLVSELTSNTASPTFTNEYGDSKSLGKNIRISNSNQSNIQPNTTSSTSSSNVTSSTSSSSSQLHQLQQQLQQQQQSGSGSNLSIASSTTNGSSPSSSSLSVNVPSGNISSSAANSSTSSSTSSSVVGNTPQQHSVSTSQQNVPISSNNSNTTTTTTTTTITTITTTTSNPNSMVSPNSSTTSTTINTSTVSPTSTTSNSNVQNSTSSSSSSLSIGGSSSAVGTNSSILSSTGSSLDLLNNSKVGMSNSGSSIPTGGSKSSDIHQHHRISSHNDIYNTISSIANAFQIATDYNNSLTNNSNSKNYPLSRFQLPLIFLSEVSFEIGEEFRKHLPTLLQLIFLGLYYHHQPVHEHCRMLLLNLIRGLVIKKCQQSRQTDTMVYEEAIQLVDYLMPNSFRSEESSSTQNLKELTSKKEISSPKYVVMLTKRVVSVLSNGSSELKEHWGTNALNWATNSSNNRLALRSFQILRGLEPTTSIDALTEVISCMSKVLHNLTPDNLILLGEIQETLLVMVRCIHPQKLILFPQLFWGTMALLQIDFEQQFINAIKLLSVLLELINFSDRAVQNVFLASLPTEWDFFHGLQPMVLRGLMSNQTSNITIEFLSTLTLQPCDEIFHPEPIRFLTNLTALLPFLCYSIGETDQDHLTYLVSDRLSVASENQGFNRLATTFANYSQQIYMKQLDVFLQEISPSLCEVVIKHSTLVFSLLFNILEFGPTEYRFPILKLLCCLVKCGVNPADTKSSRVADWYDTISIFINDHKTPSYIISQALRFVEITSGHSPTSLQSIDNALMKPSRSALTNVKKFSNKVDRGTLIASACLNKVMDSCGQRSNTSLTKSTYFTAQIFEKFFSSADEHTAKGPYDIDDNESSSSIIQGNGTNSSDLGENDTDTLHSADLSFDMGTGTVTSMGGGSGTTGNDSGFHQFPHFQGFNDILESLDDMSLNSSTIGTINGNTNNNNHINVGTIGGFGTFRDKYQDQDNISDSSSNESSFSISNSNSNSFSAASHMNTSNTSNPPITPIHHQNKSNSSSNLLNDSSLNPTSPTIYSQSNNSSNISTNRVGKQNTSPTLTTRSIHYQTNSALSTLSYNVTAAKSWWNSCSEQIEFQSEKELFDLFVAAIQLVQHIATEYKALFTQCLPVMQTISSEVSALTVDIFEKPPFSIAITEIQNTSSLVEKYKKALQEKPSLSKQFMDQREKAIDSFTTQLNVYTEQRTSTNNTRAKLFENGISNDEMQIQIAEARFCFAICNLYQQLLQLWNCNVSLEELIVDYVQQDLQLDKQKEEVKKELNKCKVLAVLIKEKESDLLSKNLQNALSNPNSVSNNLSSILHQTISPTTPLSPQGAISPHITSSPSISSPSLMDQTHRLDSDTKRKRSTTSGATNSTLTTTPPSH